MNYTNASWESDDYLTLYREMQAMAEENYREFNAKIVKTDIPMIGIRMPIIKRIAKQIAKGNYLEFIKHSSNDYYEYIMLKGLVIAFSKMPYQNFLSLSKTFIDEIDNWATCDCFCSAITPGKHSDDYFCYIENYLDSPNPWHIRVGLVTMLDYLDENHIDEVLKRCDNVTNKHYYVKMAQAWLVSTAYIKQPQQTLLYLKVCHLDDWTFNKSISKARESYRVSTQDKELLNTMKRK